jgi:HEPN domain-containing protein
MAAAHKLAVDCYPDQGSPALKLGFDHPIHHLYSHALELIIKSLLLQQGFAIAKIKSKPFGHDLKKLYSKLDPKWISYFDKAGYIEIACDHYSELRAAQFYSYPSNRRYAEYSLELADRTLNAFRIDANEIRRIFNEPELRTDTSVLKLIEEYSQPL